MPETKELTRTDKVYATLEKLVKATEESKISWHEVKDEIDEDEIIAFETHDLWGGSVKLKRDYGSAYQVIILQGTQELHVEYITLSGFGTDKRLKAYEDARKLWKLAEISGSKPDKVLDSILESLEDIDTGN